MTGSPDRVLSVVVGTDLDPGFVLPIPPDLRRVPGDRRGRLGAIDDQEGGATGNVDPPRLSGVCGYPTPGCVGVGISNGQEPTLGGARSVQVCAICVKKRNGPGVIRARFISEDRTFVR